MSDWKEIYYGLLNKPNPRDVQFEEALALKRVNLPKFLYRYRRIDLKNPNDYTIKLLESGDTWLSEPAMLNDPFDCSLSFSPRMMADHWHRTHLEEILEKTGHAGYFSAEELLEIKTATRPLAKMSEITFRKMGKPLPLDFDSFVDKLPDDILLDGVEKLVSNVRSSLRLCCFSENPYSTPMWAHYSNNHTGVCLEYDLRTWTSEPLHRLLHPVFYTDIRFDGTEHLFPENANNVYIPISASCNKAKEWSYELEWRFVVPGGIANLRPVWVFPGLTRVIVGANAPADMETRLQAIPLLKGVTIARARISPSRFKMEF